MLSKGIIIFIQDYINPCSTIECHNGGDCITDDFGQFKCVCPSGFNGTYCENNQSKNLILISN